MDRSQFDLLARLVSTKGTRRAAIAALLGTAVLGRDPAAALAKHRGKVKAQAKAKAKVKAKPCYPSTTCTPGKGKNTSGCDFSGSTAFFERDVRGSNLSNSNFTLADLRGADFRGANVSGACFVDVSLRAAKLGSSVNLGGAIFCNAIMPDGSLNNSGCDKGTACCPTTSPPGDCNTVEAFCGSVAGPCCANLECVFPPFSKCEHFCQTDQECINLFGSDYICGFPPACIASGRKCCTFFG